MYLSVYILTLDLSLFNCNSNVQFFNVSSPPLQPGKTEKHVLVIMPRDTNEQMVIQSDPNTGSATNIVVANSVIGPSGPGSAMCLTHASKERINLQKKISKTKYITVSMSSLD